MYRSCCTVCYIHNMGDVINKGSKVAWFQKMCLYTSHFISIELSLFLIVQALLERTNLGASTPKGEIHHQVPKEYEGSGT